jgi:2-dehydro-3-deoxyphosphogluconate aldolase/(4S)-4-hydroxy-2-oxoglutarate aldolase
MAKFKRLEVLTKIGKQGMIPVLYNPDPEIMKNILKACYEGGVRSFEFTNRGDFAHDVFADINRWAVKELPEMILGVGSVIEAGTASIYMQLGANFIVSPVLSEEMAKVCNRRKVAWMPGCGTPTEISKAEELGAEVVKIFPGSSVGGPAFVKAFLGPSPWSNIMPTGGVDPTEDNLKAWFDAGVFCVGMGSKLITKEIIQNRDYEKLTTICRDTLERIRKIRNNN